MMADLSTNLVALMTAIQIQLIKSETFSAIVNIRPLIATNKLVAIELADYIDGERQRLSQLQHLLSLYWRIDRDSRTDADQYLKNPVNAFLLVKRLTDDWTQVKHLMVDEANEAYHTIADIESMAVFPAEYELNSAAAALKRIQRTYKLGSTEMAEGLAALWPNSLSRTAMEVDDCAELGRQSFAELDYYGTIDWMGLALRRLSTAQTIAGDESRVEILDYLAAALLEIGAVRQALAYTEQLIKLDPNYTIAHENLLTYSRLNDDTLDGVSEFVESAQHFDSLHESLCRGEKHLSAKVEAQLFCYYHSYSSSVPYFLVRAEYVMLEPSIVVYYNVITDLEIEIVKSMATPALTRAHVLNTTTGTGYAAADRTSQSAWLDDRTHPILASLSRRIGLITGLSMASAEPLQVGNYGIGGHYRPHYDLLSESALDRESGDRIATWMFYLSDVEFGGATVFPALNVTVWPVRGAALFWYNMLESGREDERALHSACPVMIGSKWVANKWIRESGQQFWRMCRN